MKACWAWVVVVTWSVIARLASVSPCGSADQRPYPMAPANLFKLLADWRAEGTLQDLELR